MASSVTSTTVDVPLKRRKSSGAGVSARSLSGVRSPSSRPSVYAEPKEIREGDPDFPHAFVVLGATGELARRRTYPLLWNLYKMNRLPRVTYIYGFARTKMSVDDIREKCKDHMQVARGEDGLFDEFWKANRYHMGSYTSRMDFELLGKELSRLESEAGAQGSSNRLFYIALPHHLIEPALTNLGTVNSVAASSRKAGWTRVVVERPPPGRDVEQSDQKINRQLASLFREEDVYRIDPYLGRGPVRNLTAIRFGNLIFSSTWNRDCIASVLISVKEYAGIQVKEGKQFDMMGIVRESMRNHLLQILSLVAMEKPVDASAESIRDEKVKVLKSVAQVDTRDVVLGQYVGYRDEPDVPRTSQTATFCMAALRVRNERWDGVPFLLMCGKGMDETVAEVRLQYRDLPGNIFTELEDSKRNELILRLDRQRESVRLKVFVKTSFTDDASANQLKEVNLTMCQEEGSLTRMNKPRHGEKEEIKEDEWSSSSSGPYERLVMDVFNGVQTHFVRTDEVEQSWRIFEPLLAKIDEGKTELYHYEMGSSGPREAVDLLTRNNYLVDFGDGKDTVEH